jgi:hypothetical protein
MVKIAKEAGQKCTLDKPLYCPKNGEHLKIASYNPEELPICLMENRVEWGRTTPNYLKQIN